jgi:uridine kinase
MTQRQELLSATAKTILELPASFVTKVAIDGFDGAGKTVFANELASVLKKSGRPIIQASVDSFHNPRVVRYRLGKTSPEGFFRDSYNYPELKAVLLDSLSQGGSGLYQTAVFDHRTDSVVSTTNIQATPNSILIIDGIFLHRPELRDDWDYSIFLKVDFKVSIPRGAQRGEGSTDPYAVENHRYVEGQKLYLRECNPESYATIVINNEDLESPYVVT